MYVIQLLYSKALSALEHALILTFGSPVESCQLLLSYCYVIEQQNPDTMTDMKITPDGKFLYFLLALDALLTSFRNFMCPVISVDRTHLKGRHGGTMFVAASKDGNEQFLAITLAKFIQNMWQKWFYDHYRAAESMRSQLTDVAQASFLMTAHAVDWNIFSVKCKGAAQDNRWVLSIRGSFNLNVDAAFDVASGKFGLGLVVRDSQGCLCFAAATVSCFGHVSIEVTKAMAISEGIKLAVSRDLIPLSIESDALNVVQLCNNSFTSSWLLKVPVDDLSVVLSP
ncbi:hypothetical protein JRO89_XS07G0170800 [Xanthoceras sorbifolium]|uniref:RNase H type-1 domain-containing protein n=1 Tax=Xanthoceras sorbifolium TaxID=99658 RepID=A0ABQ8HU54_9ROSI|nr:hypothetical protein JRO89_XS07G0170800 [Xanthoceras sorbifolium]